MYVCVWSAPLVCPDPVVSPIEQTHTDPRVPCSQVEGVLYLFPPPSATLDPGSALSIKPDFQDPPLHLTLHSAVLLFSLLFRYYLSSSKYLQD